MTLNKKKKASHMCDEASIYIKELLILIYQHDNNMDELTSSFLFLQLNINHIYDYFKEKKITYVTKPTAFILFLQLKTNHIYVYFKGKNHI